MLNNNNHSQKSELVWSEIIAKSNLYIESKRRLNFTEIENPTYCLFFSLVYPSIVFEVIESIWFKSFNDMHSFLKHELPLLLISNFNEDTFIKNRDYFLENLELDGNLLTHQLGTDLLLFQEKIDHNIHHLNREKLTQIITACFASYYWFKQLQWKLNYIGSVNEISASLDSNIQGMIHLLGVSKIEGDILSAWKKQASNFIKFQSVCLNVNMVILSMIEHVREIIQNKENKQEEIKRWKNNFTLFVEITKHELDSLITEFQLTQDHPFKINAIDILESKKIELNTQFASL